MCAMSPIGEWIKRIFGQENPMIELCLIGCIESIEEHVPTDGEIVLYLHVSRKGQDLICFTWKHTGIVHVQVQPMDGSVEKIFTLVNPFANIPE